MWEEKLRALLSYEQDRNFLHECNTVTAKTYKLFFFTSTSDVTETGWIGQQAGSYTIDTSIINGVLVFKVPNLPLTCKIIPPAMDGLFHRVIHSSAAIITVGVTSAGTFQCQHILECDVIETEISLFSMFVYLQVSLREAFRNTL